MRKIIRAFVLCWVTSAGSVFACGVDTASVPDKSSSGEGKKAQESKKTTQDSISGGGFGLAGTTAVKDDRWEKVKKRLKKTPEGNGGRTFD